MLVVKYKAIDFSQHTCYNDGVEEYITPKQAAERKGVSVPAIYRAIERGVLSSTEVLGRKGLRPVDVDAYQPGSYGGVERFRRRRGPTKKEKPQHESIKRGVRSRKGQEAEGGTSA